MLNIGFSELLLFGIIALVVLGPDKLPTAVRTASRWYARLRFMLSNLQQDIEKELQLSELREHMQQELDRIQLIEAQMQVQLNQMSGELAELHHTVPEADHALPAESQLAQPLPADTVAVPTNHAETSSTKTQIVASQRSTITYRPIQPVLKANLNVPPYTLLHCLKQTNAHHSRPQYCTDDYAQSIMHLHVETA